MLKGSGDNTMGFDWSDLVNAKAKKASTSVLAKLVGAPEGVASPLEWKQAQENLKDPNVWNLYAYSQAQKAEDEKMDWSNFAPSLLSGGI